MKNWVAEGIASDVNDFCGLTCWVVFELLGSSASNTSPPDRILGQGWFNSMRENIEFKDGIS